jgi:hypothetical protein
MKNSTKWTDEELETGADLDAYWDEVFDRGPTPDELCQLAAWSNHLVSKVERHAV